VEVGSNIVCLRGFAVFRVPNCFKSPFGSVAAAAFYLKHSCSHLVKKKGGILFTGSYLFSALKTQYLKSKEFLFFLHYSR